MMEYNSQREHLTLPEYGRNIQKMIQQAIGIENRDDRNAAARAIVSVMAITNPNFKDVKDLEDFQHKLWDHLHIISNFELDVDGPYPAPDPSYVKAKPRQVAYPQKNVKYKHYGKNMEYFIEKGKQIEDPEIRKKFSEVLANLMKRSYLLWNRDSVNDELIREHLTELSDGKLSIDEQFRMQSTSEILGNNQPQTLGHAGKKNNQKSKQHQNKGGFQKKNFGSSNGGKPFQKNNYSNNNNNNNGGQNRPQGGGQQHRHTGSQNSGSSAAPSNPKPAN